MYNTTFKMKIIALLFLLQMSPVFAGTTPSEMSHIEKARLSLKNYGLVDCLYQGLIKEKDIKVEDIGRSAGIYGPVGQGYYNFLQDNEFNILHDPYKITRDFINEKRKLVPAKTKAGYTNLTFQCLTVFNSSEFVELVNDQDEHIIPE